MSLILTITDPSLLLRPNIPLSASTPSPSVPLDTHTRYVPPHPQRGTPYHRYVLLVLPQSSATEPIDIPVFEESDRLGFNFRAFAEQYGFDGARGGGAHMWREVWDETVSHIYKYTLSEYRLGSVGEPVLIVHRICSRVCREGGAEVWQAPEARPVRGAQAEEKVCLDASDIAHIVLLRVVALLMLSAPCAVRGAMMRCCGPEAVYDGDLCSSSVSALFTRTDPVAPPQRHREG